MKGLWSAKLSRFGASRARRYVGAVSTVISQLQSRGVSMLVVLSLTCKTTTKYQACPCPMLADPQ